MQMRSFSNSRGSKRQNNIHGKPFRLGEDIGSLLRLSMLGQDEARVQEVLAKPLDAGAKVGDGDDGKRSLTPGRKDASVDTQPLAGKRRRKSSKASRLLMRLKS